MNKNTATPPSLLKVQALKTHYTLPSQTIRGKKSLLKAVDDISFSVNKGEIVGIVGESGCGKSTLARTLIRLEQKTGGTILFNGEEISEFKGKQLKQYRKHVQMIFQDPYSSLNPRRTIGDSIKQGLQTHAIAPRAQHNKIVAQLLKEVGLSEIFVNRFPHQLSGGQRQRVCIARALSVQPQLIICDESVSALDVSIQAQILNLLLDLQEQRGLSYIFISHDLSVVEFIADRIIVMYLGKIIESAPADELKTHKLHPYSKALFTSHLLPDPHIARNKPTIRGDVPSAIHPPSGCPFHPRCPVAMDICKTRIPRLREIRPNHYGACHLYN